MLNVPAPAITDRFDQSGAASAVVNPSALVPWRVMALADSTVIEISVKSPVYRGLLVAVELLTAKGVYRRV
jgi:hypothetical protein